MINLSSSQTSTYKSLGGREFKEEYTKSKHPVLIDVRTAAEFACGSIHGARNIDILSPDFGQHISSLDKNKDYFVFCRSGGRSAQACNIMSAQGFVAYNLEGGVGAWPA